MKWDMKLVSGVFFFLMDLATFIFGGILTFRGAGLLVSGGGGGNIKLAVEKIGEVTGVNGQVLILCAGLALVLASIGYARKSFQEARALEGGLKDTIRHFSPL